MRSHLFYTLTPTRSGLSLTRQVYAFRMMGLSVGLMGDTQELEWTLETLRDALKKKAMPWVRSARSRKGRPQPLEVLVDSPLGQEWIHADILGLRLQHIDLNLELILYNDNYRYRVQCTQYGGCLTRDHTFRGMHYAFRHYIIALRHVETRQLGAPGLILTDDDY